MNFKYTFLLLTNFILILSCNGQQKNKLPQEAIYKSIKIFEDKKEKRKPILPGADVIGDFLHELQDKKIAIVTNQTGILTSKNNQHLVDFLIEKNIRLKKIFSPEHGFRGIADAGEKITDGQDAKTGLPIISLYGRNKKPKPSQLQGIDLILFDLQDVGVRFYTYISTLHYTMEAAAEQNIPIWILDRPNPNAHYIDGPMREKGFESFVGMHPVPIVYGMTIGEYAQMINGEKWLKNQVQANLKVIKIKNYNHQMLYDLPLKPSPNLPNKIAINLYPSLCFFEGTNISEGRGTDCQFQVYGSPNLRNMPFKFIPKSNEGAKNPKFKGEACFGEDLRNTERLAQIELKWLIKAYKNHSSKKNFFIIPKKGIYFFDKLAGTHKLRRQIEQGFSSEQIKSTWQKDLKRFKEIRAKYLLYP